MHFRTPQRLEHGASRGVNRRDERWPRLVRIRAADDAGLLPEDIARSAPQRAGRSHARLPDSADRDRRARRGHVVAARAQPGASGRADRFDVRASAPRCEVGVPRARLREGVHRGARGRRDDGGQQPRTDAVGHHGRSRGLRACRPSTLGGCGREPAAERVQVHPHPWSRRAEGVFDPRANPRRGGGSSSTECGRTSSTWTGRQKSCSAPSRSRWSGNREGRVRRLGPPLDTRKSVECQRWRDSHAQPPGWWAAS